MPPPQPPPIIVLSEIPFIVKRWSCVWPPWMAEGERVRAERAADVLVGEAAGRQRDAGDEHAEVEHVASGGQRVDHRRESRRSGASWSAGPRSAVSPVTVMVSDTLPTFSSPLSVSVNDPDNSRPSRLTVLNPVSVNVTV